MSSDVGSAAPDFTLMNQDRQPVTLSAARGRPVVLAFFPAAFSAGCTKQLCVDSFFALKAFQADQKVGFPLLSDFNKQVIREYGVYNNDMIGLKGIAKRSVFVLDRGGVVRHREILEDARHELNYDAVFAALASIEAAGV
jgi:peroxiredoxin